MKSVNLHMLHVFAFCVWLYVRCNLEFCVISDRHLGCSCALFRFLLQVRREAEGIYQMGWA